MIHIKPLHASDTYPIRIEILRNGIAQNYRFSEDTDSDTFHFGIFDNNQCIGISTYIKKECPLMKYTSSYQLRGMAILTSYQRQGLGEQLLQYAYKQLSKKNCQLIWCNARETAVPFYKKLGFTVIGNPFEITGIGTHYVMYIRI